MTKPVILCILDGWGLREDTANNAPALAKTPAYDRIMASCPHATLVTYGPDVGLPEGQMGNSEVGHTNIGAGRVVLMDLLQIDKVVRDDALGDQAALTVLFLALVAPALLVMPLWTRYAAAHGKPAALTLASAAFAVATLALVGMLWWPGWWVYAAVGVAGIAYAGLQLFPLAMLPDVITAAGRGRGGAMSGLWTAGETTGLALGPVVVLLLLTVTGFRSSTAGERLAQPDAALVAVVLAFSLVPALLVAASLLVLRRYREPPAPADPAPRPAATHP